jgi:hypothetical protein
MPRKPRIQYTETDKALMWDRWRKGDSLETANSRPNFYSPIGSGSGMAVVSPRAWEWS